MADTGRTFWASTFWADGFWAVSFWAGYTTSGDTSKTVQLITLMDTTAETT